MLLYLTKLTIILAVALLIYKLILENTMAHHFKRYYLLVGLVISFTLPLITLSVPLGPTVVNDTLTTFSETIIVLPNTQKLASYDWQSLLIAIYTIGVITSFTFLIAEVYQIEKLKRKGTKVEFEGMTIILLDKLNNTFSFGKHIYLPLSQELSLTNKILLHEKTHIVQYHTLDILFIEIVKVVFWFHPLFYYYKTCIALNHEFLADKGSIASKEETNAYLELLLNQTCKKIETNIISSFNFNLTKKRFVMITKDKKPMYDLAAIALSSTLFLGIGVFTINTQAAPSPQKVINKQQIYTATEIPATYKGGINQFVQDFVSRLEVPKQLHSNRIENSMIIVQFTITREGTLEDFNILKDPLGIGDQVISILENLPPWSPAKHNGESVPSKFTLPIKLK
ncbi:M56 family metallopeptidase [Myroides albus]|uniref:M56 family metallopeptidase n=1 Tax=Myroides albus TaxID=2562892 RepID=UPI0021597110|nr:M56 family metallopeptidase [Myroides albus]UVD80130.1 M56 family metallopeptidase [Myroides albus]